MLHSSDDDVLLVVCHIGYPLPALPDGVSLQNPTLVVNDGYVSVGLDLAFAGLSSAAAAKIQINNN